MEITPLFYLLLCVGVLFGAAVASLFLSKKNQQNQRKLTKDYDLVSDRYEQLQANHEGLQLKNDELIHHNKDIETQRYDIEKQLAVKVQEISQLEQYKIEAIEHRQSIVTLSNTKTELEEKLKQFKETKAKVQNLESKLEQQYSENKQQAAQLATLNEQLSHYGAMTQKTAGLEGELLKSQQRVASGQTEIAELTTLLEQERKGAAEKLSLLSEAKDELAHRFKTVAQEIFEEKGAKFNTKQEKELGNILDPLKEQLTSFNKRINDIHESSTKDQASLRQELETLRKSNMDLNKEARNLSKALKGDQKMQGNWGEMILEKILEHSGLRKGKEYETQSNQRDDDNKLYRPDIIIHLPENRHLIIDSKVSLVAYEKSCSAEDPLIQEQALAAHVQSIRNHIKQLSDKDYSNLPGVKSPDFVLLFMPIEPAFMVAFQADEELFQYGFERRIIVVTPTTLLATLRTIQNIWQFERQNQNTKEIADRAGKIYEKIRLCLESMEDLGKQIHKAQSTYDTAMKRLSTGRGNIVNQANELVKLGVKVKKEMPKQLVESATSEIVESS